jgi:hypothetical protein
VSLERTLTTNLTACLELQLDAGDGPPAWATEFGLICRLTPRISLDLGASLGIGRNSRARETYGGIGWHF